MRDASDMHTRCSPHPDVAVYSIWSVVGEQTTEALVPFQSITSKESVSDPTRERAVETICIEPNKATPCCIERAVAGSSTPSCLLQGLYFAVSCRAALRWHSIEWTACREGQNQAMKYLTFEVPR